MRTISVYVYLLISVQSGVAGRVTRKMETKGNSEEEERDEEEVKQSIWAAEYIQGLTAPDVPDDAPGSLSMREWDNFFDALLLEIKETSQETPGSGEDMNLDARELIVALCGEFTKVALNPRAQRQITSLNTKLQPICGDDLECSKAEWGGEANGANAANDKLFNAVAENDGQADLGDVQRYFCQ